MNRVEIIDKLDAKLRLGKIIVNIPHKSKSYSVYNHHLFKEDLNTIKTTFFLLALDDLNKIFTAVHLVGVSGVTMNLCLCDCQFGEIKPPVRIPPRAVLEFDRSDIVNFLKNQALSDKSPLAKTIMKKYTFKTLGEFLPDL